MSAPLYVIRESLFYLEIRGHFNVRKRNCRVRFRSLNYRFKETRVIVSSRSVLHELGQLSVSRNATFRKI